MEIMADTLTICDHLHSNLKEGVDTKHTVHNGLVQPYPSSFSSVATIGYFSTKIT